MWTCQHCSETIDDSFDACWNCGSNQKGSPNPSFQSTAEPDDTANLNDHYEPLRFSLRAILVFTALTTLFLAILKLLLSATQGDWGLSLTVALIVTVVLLWICLRARCDNCGRWWQKRKTGQEENICDWPNIRREEYQCRVCAHTEWRLQLPGHASGE
jgi:hypothetical protein